MTENNEIKLKSKTGFLKYVFFALALGIGFGAVAGWWLKPVWSNYSAPDSAFAAEFRTNPIQMGFPKPREYDFAEDDMLQIYSVKDKRGIDEINRLDNITSAQADQEWFEQTVKQTGATLLEGNKDDFSLHITESDVYLRGRIIFAERGKGIYKIFIIRGSRVELGDLDSIRFLYGIKFK